MSVNYSGGSPLGKGIGSARLNDVALVDLLAGYRRRVAGNYRPLPPEEIAKLSSGKMWVSVKVDGELWFLVAVGEEVILANPSGEVIAGEIGVISAAGKLPEGTIIAGELHARVEGRRARVGDLAALLGGGTSAKTDEAAFMAFDLVRSGENAELGGYGDRLQTLANLIKPSDHLRVVETSTLATAVEVKELFEKRVLTGEAEGLVVRLETGLIQKLKPEVTFRAAIIAYTLKADQPDMVRSVLLGVSADEGRWQILGGCGNLGSDEDRKSLLARLKPLTATSQARIASDGGGLYTFVKPEVGVKVTATDLQTLKSDGTPTDGLLVKFGVAGWETLGLRSTLRPIHPVVTEVEEGKGDPKDHALNQIADRLPPRSTKGTDGAELPASTLLRREVWTKTTKGATAVRKLLVWKTNKEKADPAFPAYVIHWTDYSAGRATPLDRDVIRAPDEAEATKIAEALIAENIKKGWNKEST